MSTPPSTTPTANNSAPISRTPSLAAPMATNTYPAGPSAPEPYAPNSEEYAEEERIRSRAGTGQSASGRTLNNSSAEGSSGEKIAYGSSKAEAANNSGPANGAGAPGGKGPRKFAHNFWDPEMAKFRGIAFKILGMTVVITTLVVWLCLPVYWGSLWKANKYTDKLTVRIINRDSGTVGSNITDTLLAQKNLRYFETSASEFPTNDLVANDVVEEGVWAAIVISEGVSDGLVSARENGLASWNGSNAIEVFYAQGRQEMAINTYMLPYIQASLSQICSQMNAQDTAAYLQANANNATAIGLLAQAPTTLTNGVWYTLNNLRPYNQPVATAITLVGLIYMLILSFIMTMTNNAVREIIAPFLKTRSYIMYRLITPLCLYLVISFFFVMVNLPFKVHFDAHYTYAGGFFLWWFSLYLGMCSVGLATEAAITVLGPKFMAFFLIPIIIVNVSVCSLPHELQPWIYRYGVAMPFYNCNRIVRTIIFNTKNDIGMNLGILIAWIVVSFITISLGTWLFRRRSVNQHNKELGESEFD
ncbi:hypothetical protein L202_02510 [Cryptococcus amylolentus CBS 6039]|uniref:DUF3533 domain-containing protein n=2 Tax=Cryptococcus amylolentus TaxID=104669 RepID=A0A1E3I0U6_9TREE|nr:hypothetical protein L202_02510 [Cryptococcus amylolentus CBS 6039]ODN82224.1 hypothetical protein L202_02510 [Cryptococcus amylolentus CBS 6039]ODO09695.1 hypothetical protein I350_01909 [Cryptococcus amylolentus CBS 6273]